MLFYLGFLGSLIWTIKAAIGAYRHRILSEIPYVINKIKNPGTEDVDKKG
jgi:hypothetical protein